MFGHGPAFKKICRHPSAVHTTGSLQPADKLASCGLSFCINRATRSEVATKPHPPRAQCSLPALALPILFTGLSAAQTITGQFDCLPAGGFTLCQNLWGKTSGVGSQKSTLMSATTETVAWATNYTWANGPNQVKSCAHFFQSHGWWLKMMKCRRQPSAPTLWDWTYATQSVGIRADVAYDIWFGKASSGNPATSASAYEIMIWLSGLGGIQPVGSQITTGTVVANHTWNLWKGPNANWEVLSFVSAAGDLNSFDVDLNDFFTYLVEEQGVAPTQYIQSIQAGTEAFVGTANLVTNAYSVSIVPK
ncbi:endoglucanase [Mycena olivaceomarginata]|nr:endoglucanase [Mycena olivaceomarginata]